MQTNSAGSIPAGPVLPAVDGSEHGLRTVDWALDAARARGAALHVVHARPDAPRGHAPGEAPVPPPVRDGDPVLDAVRARPEGREQLPPVTYVSRDAAPSAALVELAAGARLARAVPGGGRSRTPVGDGRCGLPSRVYDQVGLTGQQGE
ncbi:universal stress protein [Streptomyces sp. H27-H1]|uniref:universal stress protein n=1 Tax=Streptomyces sp. H27-H1 TaxID=2996461 RepID=UPI002271DC58|nr:universal stress protein [Streptomyces sp. H27-H1]MCY0928652.1 universal stress protein [Streptomyces sp. H27-H1]